MSGNRRKIKKVMIIVPPMIILKDSFRRAPEPLGALAVGSVLDSAGYEVCIYDMICEHFNEIYPWPNGASDKTEYIVFGGDGSNIVSRLLEFKPDAVGVSCIFSSREKPAFSVLEEVRKFDDSIITIIGGLPASLEPERFLKTGLIDYVVSGEGDFRVKKLFDNLNAGVSPDNDLDGIHYFESGDTSKYINKKAVSYVDDLDSLPFPNRKLLNMEKYLEIAMPDAMFPLRKRVAAITATRGCPCSCNFCSTSDFFGKTVRKRSVDNVIKEIQSLIDDYAIEEVQFNDANLIINKEYARELFKRMKDLNINFCTPSGLYLNSLDEEMIKLMKEAGAYQLTFSVENGSTRVLKDIIKKPVILDRIKKLVECAHFYDISVHASFIIGFPGETNNEIIKTLNFPYLLEVDSISVFLATPLPGSELYEECKSKGYLKTSSSEEISFKAINIEIPETSQDWYGFAPAELERLADKTTREYNTWANKKYPERSQRKFKSFLKNHPEFSDIMDGRIT